MKHLTAILLISLFLISINTLYWVFSDIQQKCYNKIKPGIELNLYEKISIYSINLGMCTFGAFVSPEAAVQQFLCTVPTKDTVILHSKFLTKHEKIQKHLNTNSNNPILLSWADYQLNNFRVSLACNGLYLQKENDTWIIYPKHGFIYPNLSKVTNIGPFKIHEGLIRYLQDIGWLYKPNFKWVLN